MSPAKAKEKGPLTLIILTGLPTRDLGFCHKYFPFQAQQETMNSPDGVTTVGCWPVLDVPQPGATLPTSIPTSWSGHFSNALSILAPPTHWVTAPHQRTKEWGRYPHGYSPPRPGRLTEA